MCYKNSLQRNSLILDTNGECFTVHYSPHCKYTSNYAMKNWKLTAPTTQQAVLPWAMSLSPHIKSPLDRTN